MNKVELIEKIAIDAKINKTTANEVVSLIIKNITEALNRGEEFNFAGLGTFKIKIRKARVGRNPKTGESVQIPTRKAPVFKASATLKNAIK